MEKSATTRKKTGRPRKVESEKKSVTVKVRMSPQMYEAVRRVANGQRKVPGLIRRLLRGHLGAVEARERRKEQEHH